MRTLHAFVYRTHDKVQPEEQKLTKTLETTEMFVCRYGRSSKTICEIS